MNHLNIWNTVRALLLLWILQITPAFGQTVTSTINFTITHATCNESNGTVDYTIVLSNGWSKFSVISNLKLYYDNQVAGTSDLVMDHVAIFGNKSETGTATHLWPGHYYFTGSITTRDNGGMTVAVPVNEHFWLGYQTQWDGQSEVANNTTAYSAYRYSTSSGSTYGWASSFNTLSASYGFLELSKKPAAGFPSTLYCVLDPGVNLASFTPSGSYQYLEFNETSAGTGTIKLKYYSGGSYFTTTLSSAITDKVRVIRSAVSSSCQVQLNKSQTNVAPSFSVSGSLKVQLVAQQLNTEASGLISTFPCSSQTLTHNGYSLLKRELDAGYALTASGTLKFFFDEEYKIQGGSYIPLKIYDEDRLLKSSVALDGTLGGSNPSSALKLSYAQEDNRKSVVLTGCGLTNGKIYLLEVTTSTNEKRYLKFKYIN